MSKNLTWFLLSLSCVNPMWGSGSLEAAEEVVSDADLPEKKGDLFVARPAKEGRMSDAKLYMNHLLGEDRWKQFITYSLLVFFLTDWLAHACWATDRELKMPSLTFFDIMIVYFANRLTLPQSEDPVQDARIKNLWESIPAISVAFKVLCVWRRLAPASSRFFKALRFAPFFTSLLYPLVKHYFPPSQRYIWEGESIKASLTSQQTIRFGVGFLAYVIARFINRYGKIGVIIEDALYALDESSDAKLAKLYTLFTEAALENDWINTGVGNNTTEKLSEAINKNSLTLIFLFWGYLGCCAYDMLSDASEYRKVAQEVREAEQSRIKLEKDQNAPKSWWG